MMTSADKEKRGVALSSLLAAILLTLTKAGIGIWTNSLGILSEAAHSGLDLLAAAITLWAVRVAGKPADPEHTYGHGKFENLSAMIETLLLLVTCVWIIYEATHRLFVLSDVEVDPNIWAFLVVMLSIVVDVSRSRALHRVAEKYHSQALEADAVHFSTDIWSSSVVLIGLVGVLLAERFSWPWLAKADSVAALGVAVIVIGVSIKLGKKSIGDLLDAVPRDLRRQVVDAVAGVSGVEEIKQVRVRRSGPEVFADVTLTVDSAAGLERAHEIADRTEAAVRAVLPGADIVLHVEPAAGQLSDDLLGTVRRLAARHNLGAHGMRLYEQGSERWLELHLEVDEKLTLDEAHRLATDFEQAARAAIPGLTQIVPHLEPARDKATTQRAAPAERVWHQRVLQALGEFSASQPQAFDPHEVRVQMVGAEPTVSMHCTLAAATAITDAHEFTERLENFLRSRLPDLGRVVIHAEPASSPASATPSGQFPETPRGHAG